MVGSKGRAGPVEFVLYAVRIQQRVTACLCPGGGMPTFEAASYAWERSATLMSQNKPDLPMRVQKAPSARATA